MLCPALMTTLSIVGTATIFLVGGSIILQSHSISHNIDEIVKAIPTIGNLLSMVAPLLINAILGIVIGTVTIGIINPPRYIYKK